MFLKLYQLQSTDTDTHLNYNNPVVKVSLKTKKTTENLHQLTVEITTKGRVQSSCFLSLKFMDPAQCCRR